MLNTFIIPVIIPDYIERCLETIYKNSPANFYVYIVDMTIDGLDLDRRKYANLMVIRPPLTLTHQGGNLGFAKANNIAIQLVETPYMTLCNDDVEFVDPRWWEGIMETFNQVDKATPHRPCLGVNPSSIKLPDWSIGRPAGEHHEVIPYKEQYTNEDWHFLLEHEHYVNEHLTIQPNSVIDGVAMYCSVVRTTRFLDVGLLDEHFYPGGGEDYDYMARCSMFNYRFVGTTKSWVYHHWSSTLASERGREAMRLTVDENLKWNNNNEKWGENFDIWGIKSKCGEPYKRLGLTRRFQCQKHPDDKYMLPEVTQTPL
jgi:GT2 family glycosyltransferase